MSQRFRKIIPWLLKWETVFDKNGKPIAEDDKDDPGGLTKFGIDKRSHPNEDIRSLTEERAKEIYWREYWQRNECGSMQDGLGECFFNACVNCGAGRAEKLARESVGDPSRFLDAQEMFYKRLVSVNPKAKKYLRGWLNRTADLRRFLGIKGGT